MPVLVAGRACVVNGVVMARANRILPRRHRRRGQRRPATVGLVRGAPTRNPAGGLHWGDGLTGDPPERSQRLDHDHQSSPALSTTRHVGNQPLLVGYLLKLRRQPACINNPVVNHDHPGRWVLIQLARPVPVWVKLGHFQGVAHRP